MSEAQQEYSLPAAGKLKIFFGYAAGVGKTYAMLEAAHQAKQEGIDVVVGYVEPHARPDTLALLNGLEAIPCREINYRGIRLKEFDLDAALRRKPQLILVDELAHSNAQGSRHTKRYQDVEELLKVKAAFSQALEALLRAAGLAAADVACLALAGALGEHCPPACLEELGFLPSGMGRRVRAVGNSSLDGAALLAAEPWRLPALARWCAAATLVPVAEDPGFHADYMRHMRFGV